MTVKQVLGWKVYNIKTVYINKSEVQAEQFGSTGKDFALNSVGAWFESQRQH
jgi:hypothetical protein